MTTLFERNEDRVTGFLKWTDFISKLFLSILGNNLGLGDLCLCFLAHLGFFDKVLSLLSLQKIWEVTKDKDTIPLSRFCPHTISTLAKSTFNAISKRFWPSCSLVCSIHSGKYKLYLSVWPYLSNIWVHNWVSS